MTTIIPALLTGRQAKRFVYKERGYNQVLRAMRERTIPVIRIGDRLYVPREAALRQLETGFMETER